MTSPQSDAWNVAQPVAGLVIGLLGASVIVAYTGVNRGMRAQGPRAHWWWGLVLATGGMTLLGVGWWLLATTGPRLGLEWGGRMVGALFALAALLVYVLSARWVGRWRAPSRYDLGLRTEGIYARVRHPQALSLCLLVVAIALLSDSAPYAITLPLWLGFWFAYTYVEERRELLPTFGAEYREYMRTTPRLLPRLRVR